MVADLCPSDPSDGAVTAHCARTTVSVAASLTSLDPAKSVVEDGLELEILAPALAACRGLRHLDLSGCGLGDKRHDAGLSAHSGAFQSQQQSANSAIQPNKVLRNFTPCNTTIHAHHLVKLIYCFFECQ
jgi:hypothetical protein